MHFDPVYMMIIGLAMLASHLVGAQLKHKFALYSRVPLPVTGRQVAERMLARYGVGGVRVVSTPGMLSDHYNPANKTVNLSDHVYSANTVAAAAVAAHEVGHAVQHASSYPALAMRSALVPVVKIGSGLAPWLLVAGLGLAATGGGLTMMLIGIILFAATTLFAFITLPVEFDASRRALIFLQESGLTGSMEQGQAKDALFWAAMTYVVAALASLGQLLYFVMLFLKAKNRN